MITTPSGRAQTPGWPGRALALAALVAVVAAWEALARGHGSLLFPTFSRTLVAFADLARRALPEALWVSNQAMLGGFLLATALGVPLGLLLGRLRGLERASNLYLNILLVTLMTALIPLCVIALGLGLASRILVVFTFAFPLVVVNTKAGMRKVDASLIDMARSFGASELQLWTRIFLPSAFPAVFTGLRLGLGRSLAGMVAAELLLAPVGLGDLLLRYQSDFRADYMFAVTLAVILEAVLIMSPLRYLEQRLSPWVSQVQPR